MVFCIGICYLALTWCHLSHVDIHRSGTTRVHYYCWWLWQYGCYRMCSHGWAWSQGKRMPWLDKLKLYQIRCSTVPNTYRQSVFDIGKRLNKTYASTFQKWIRNILLLSCWVFLWILVFCELILFCLLQGDLVTVMANDGNWISRGKYKSVLMMSLCDTCPPY